MITYDPISNIQGQADLAAAQGEVFYIPSGEHLLYRQSNSAAALNVPSGLHMLMASGAVLKTVIGSLEDGTPTNSSTRPRHTLFLNGVEDILIESEDPLNPGVLSCDGSDDYTTHQESEVCQSQILMSGFCRDVTFRSLVLEKSYHRAIDGPNDATYVTDLTVEGCTVRLNNNNGLGAPQTIRGRFIDNLVENCGVSDGHWGMYFSRYLMDCEISGNTVLCDFGGIKLTKASVNCLIERNHIEIERNQGFVTEQGEQAGHRFRLNYVKALPAAMGFHMNDVINARVEGNNIEGCSLGLFRNGCHNMLVLGNSADGGMTLLDNNDVVIEGNVLQGGVYLGDLTHVADGALVHGNTVTITGAEFYAIYAQNTRRWKVENNVVLQQGNLAAETSFGGLFRRNHSPLLYISVGASEEIEIDEPFVVSIDDRR